MKIGFLGALMLPLLFCGSLVHAQVNLEGVSSGRYEIHKSSRLPNRSIHKEEKNKEKFETNIVIEQENEPISENTEVPVSERVSGRRLASIDEEMQMFSENEPTIRENVEGLFGSKIAQIKTYYKNHIKPEDLRQNRVELDLLPVLGYNDSKSNYSYRNYQALVHALDFRTNVWFTPRLGLYGNAMFSIAADIDANDVNKSRSSVNYENLDLGLKFRSFKDLSFNSSSLEFVLLLSDNKLSVSTNSSKRANLQSQGLGAAIKARMPTSSDYAWTFAGCMFPNLMHSEVMDGTTNTSGDSNKSIRMGLGLGGEWIMNREGQIIWDLGVNAEKNLFTGTANLQDPSTGSSPSNVSVTNSFYTFSLGYRWGR